jgi:hypothetical protein
MAFRGRVVVTQDNFKVSMGEVAGKKAGFLDSRTQKYE